MPHNEQNEQDIPWFQRRINEIFFLSLYDWNEMFKRVMKKQITEEEFRTYIIKERKGFSAQVMELCEKFIGEGIGYKQLSLSLSEDMARIAEEKLKKMEESQ